MAQSCPSQYGRHVRCWRKLTCCRKAGGNSWGGPCNDDVTVLLDLMSGARDMIAFVIVPAYLAPAEMAGAFSYVNAPGMILGQVTWAALFP